MSLESCLMAKAAWFDAIKQMQKAREAEWRAMNAFLREESALSMEDQLRVVETFTRVMAPRVSEGDIAETFNKAMESSGS